MTDEMKKYNSLLERLNKAEVYFQEKYELDTEDGKEWALKTLRQLVLEQEKMYKCLRQHSTTEQLLNGFKENQMTVCLETSNIDNIVERLNIIQADGWKIEKLEFLRKSQKLLVGYKRSEFIEQN